MDTKPQDRKVRILIAAASQVLRDRICWRLESTGGMETMGETRHPTGTLQKARTLTPDVIIVVDFLPPMENGHASAFLMKEDVSAAVLAFTRNLESEWIQYLFRHGVTGFIHIDELDTLVVEAVLSVNRGERYLSPKARLAFENL